MRWRDEAFWQGQSGLSTSKIRHRRAGQQIQHPLKNIQMFLGSRCPGEDMSDIALQRQRWRNLETDWLMHGTSADDIR
eukprot:12226096-Karenia_brevis.AAC.1